MSFRLQQGHCLVKNWDLLIPYNALEQSQYQPMAYQSMTAIRGLFSITEYQISHQQARELYKDIERRAWQQAHSS